MLDAALKLWQRHRRHAQERRGLTVALDAVEFGIILVDREGEVGFANAAARARGAREGDRAERLLLGWASG